jgi:hypothetical protein
MLCERNEKGLGQARTESAKLFGWFLLQSRYSYRGNWRLPLPVWRMLQEAREPEARGFLDG